MIGQIEVSNFKSLKHLYYKCANLNLLMGLNGSGKSSFIQVMMLLKKAASRIAEPRFRLKLNDSRYGLDIGRQEDLFYCFSNEDAEIRIKPGRSSSSDVPELIRMLRRTNPTDSEVVMESPLYKKYMDMGEESLALTGKSAEIDYAEMRSGNVELIRHEEEQSCVMARMPLERILFVSAFRMKPTREHAIAEDPIDEDDQEIHFDPEGGDVVSFLSKYGAREDIVSSCMFHSSCQRKDLLSQVQAWLSVVSPGARVVIEDFPRADRVVMSIGYEVQGTCHAFRPQNVGAGITNILPVLVAVLTAGPFDTLIVENPEVHLHPRGQAEMGRLLALATLTGAQVFVETHSDHVINGIRVAVKKGIIKPDDVNIAFFTRKEHEVVGEANVPTMEIYSEEQDIKIDADGELSDYPSDFMDEWNNQLLELI